MKRWDKHKGALWNQDTPFVLRSCSWVHIQWTYRQKMHTSERSSDRTLFFFFWKKASIYCSCREGLCGNGRGGLRISNSYHCRLTNELFGCQRTDIRGANARLLRSCQSSFLTGSQDYTSKGFGLFSKWQQPEKMGWNSDESGGMLALSGTQPFTLSYCRERPGAPRDACACAQADTRVQNACAQAGADSPCGIKVTESWQISAAAESLTWGCWIDNPSVGTLLAFSSFWEEQNESRVVQMLLHEN